MQKPELTNDESSVKNKGGTGAEKFTLLTSTTFEQAKPGQLLSAIARATSEVLTLKHESSRPRAMRQDSGVSTSSQAACGDRHQVAGPSDETDVPMDDVITRMATEIAELKVELRLLQSEHVRQRRQLEERLASKDSQCAQQVAALETKLAVSAEQHKLQLKSLEHDHQQDLVVKELARDQLIQEMQQLQTAYEAHIKDLEARLRVAEEHARNKLQEYEVKLRSRDEELRELTGHVSQLRAYIGEGAVQQLQTEAELQGLEFEQMSLMSTNELLEVRLDALNKILALQEAELALRLKDDAEGTVQGLLTRWREKVFGLLVQLKSEEISHKRALQTHQEKETHLEDQVRSGNRQSELLNHLLTARQAELHLEKTNIRLLQAELNKSQQLVQELQNQQKHQETPVMARLVKGFSQEVNMTINKLNSMLHTLSVLSHRINFATSRVHLLQVAFAKREAMLVQNLSSPSRSRTPTSQHQTVAVIHRSERHASSVASPPPERVESKPTTNMDSVILYKQVVEIKQQYDIHVQSLEDEVKKLRYDTDKETSKCLKLKEELDRTKSELRSAQRTIQALKVELAEHQVAAAKESIN